MDRLTLKIFLLIAGLGLCGYASAGGRYQGPAQPVIVKVAKDAKENTIIITGRNFGQKPPAVHLAGQVLDVSRFTENRIVALLPPDIEQATYGLTVTANGQSRVTSNVFAAALPGWK